MLLRHRLLLAISSAPSLPLGYGSRLTAEIESRGPRRGPNICLLGLYNVEGFGILIGLSLRHL